MTHAASSKNFEIMTQMIPRSIGLILEGDISCRCLWVHLTKTLKSLRAGNLSAARRPLNSYLTNSHALGYVAITQVEGYMSLQCTAQELCCLLSCSCRMKPPECSNRMCHQEDHQGNVFQYQPSPHPGWKRCLTGRSHTPNKKKKHIRQISGQRNATFVKGSENIQLMKHAFEGDFFSAHQ